jgi:hypothetical protein
MNRKQFWLTLTAGAACSVALAPQPSMAQQAVRLYRIEAQPLDAALKRFAAISGVEILFNEEDVAGKQAPALDGRFELNEALDHLLSSSGLRSKPAGPNTVVLRLAQRTN